MISTFDSEVLDIKNLDGNVRVLKLSAPGNFSFKAGQYVSISVPFEGKKLRRPYSIASPPNEKSIELCIKIVDGSASNYVKALSKGNHVELFGPAGKFVLDNEAKNKDIIFIAVGTGITPFKSMIFDLLQNRFKNKIILLKGFRYEENILYDDEFSELAKKHKNFEFHNVLSRPRNQEFENKGYVQDFLEKYISKNFRGDFYICGLSPMINAVKEKLLSLGTDENRIFYEKYD